MSNIFSDRISDVPKSFIREILKVAVDEDVISFAGGLPNRDLFPIEELNSATNLVFRKVGSSALQYSSSEGSVELRKFISNGKKSRFNISIPIKNILITSGSQQGFDLLGKSFLNDGDDIIIEESGCLGPIQAFSVHKAKFNPVAVSEDGMDIDALGNTLSAAKPKSSFKQLIPERTIMLGSFSKTVVPGFRLGWIVANDEIYEKLLIAKEASDLHTNQFVQCVMDEYLAMGSFDKHVSRIKKVYGKQRYAMINSIKRYFPTDVQYTQPNGGMFL